MSCVTMTSPGPVTSEITRCARTASPGHLSFESNRCRPIGRKAHRVHHLSAESLGCLDGTGAKQTEGTALSPERHQPVTRRQLFTGAAKSALGIAALGWSACGSSAKQDVPATDATLPIAIPTFTPSPGMVEDAAPQVADIFPLQVHDGERFLRDQSGHPFFLRGDSAWSMIANLTQPEAEFYLRDRSSRGFNSVLVNLLEHKFAVDAPANRDGDQPFLTPGKFSTANPRYFDFAETVVAAAEAQGMAVFLAFLYLGYGGDEEGWWSELTSDANSEDDCLGFGRFVAERFSDHKNVVFVAGGDYLPPTGSKGAGRLVKVAQGIRDGGATQLMTGHWSPESLSTDQKDLVPFLRLNGVYTYGSNKNGVTYPAAWAGFKRGPALPVFLSETGYEGEGWIPGDRVSIRSYLTSAIFGGATAGAFYGHRDIWEFATNSWSSGFGFGPHDWRESLDAPAASDFCRLAGVLDSLPWHEFVPIQRDSKRVAILEGGGNWGDDDYVTAVTDGHATVVCYLPPKSSVGRNLRLSLEGIARPLRAEWVDPTTAHSIPVHIQDQSTVLDVRAPGKNESSATDWLLVVRSASEVRDLNAGPRLVGLARD